MRITLGYILAITAFALAATAHAAPLTYTNVDIGVITTELKNPSIDGDGLLLRGSLTITKNVFLTAQLSDIGYSHDTDGVLWGIGAGGHIAATNAIDLVGTLAILHQDIDNRDSENGYAFTGTARGFVVDKLELEGGIKHVHFEDSGNSTSLIGEGRYFFTDRIAGGVLLQVGDTSSVGINVRFTF